MKAVNLIPSEQRRARASGEGAGGAYVVLGVLGLLFVMATLYVLTANQVNDRTTKAEAASQEADALEAQSKQLGSFTNFASIKDQRLASVIMTSQTRFDWERLMRELSRVMPAGSWLQTTEATVVGDDTAATTGAVSSTPTPTGPTAKFSGCTPTQRDAARLMVRLRQMARVSDVTLNESAQESPDAETTFDSCGRLYHFDVTVSFAPVPSATEAPRGSNSVPAALGGGS